MSSPIAPTPTSAGIAVVRGAALARPAGPQATRGPAAAAPAVSLDAIPSSPPAEVIDQMTDAAQIYERLSSQGRELRFARDEASGRTTIEVRDRRGNVLKQLSPAQALDVAAGAPLE